MAEASTQFDIKVRERLVKQQQLWLGRQGAGQGNPLLLATRKLMRVTLAQTTELDQLEHFLDHVLLLWVFANAECNVLRHGEVREQCIVLEHHADSAFFWREGEPCFGDDFAGQLYLALMHGLKAGNGA